MCVQKQPPKYVYSNESFEVTLQLENSKAGSPVRPMFAGSAIELLASLHHEKTGIDCGPEALLITQPSRIIMSPNEDGIHRCSVVCMIRMDSIQRDQGASLVVKFQPRPDSSPPIRAMSGAATNPIHLVNYKIRITLEQDWGPVWYKDEGGRDKSMEIYASIYDKDGQLRTGEQIPLHPTLCYDSSGNLPVPCSNQDILRSLGASRILIDKDTGRARIRFRVEDVSKNHQAQDFVLQLGPDPKAKGFRDIAPDYTPGVNVRSKRNKRTRTHTRSASDQSRRLSPVAMMRPRFYEEPDSSSMYGPADIPLFREALKSVINWVDEVVNGLYPLQWQVLGYAHLPDGSPDYSQPYHNMPNPNAYIDRILGLYSDTVRSDLQVLLDSVERGNPRSDDPSSIMPVPVAAPGPVGDDPMMYPSVIRSPPPTNQMHRRTVMPHTGQGPSDSYSSAPPQDSMYQTRAGLPPPPPHMMPHLPPPLHMVSQPYRYMRDYEMMYTQPGMPPPPPREMQSMSDLPTQRSRRGGSQSLSGPSEEDSREAEVEYVMAKQYKALRTGERLGFPAYSGNKEILGFYREPHQQQQQQGAGGSTRQFSPISRHRQDFGPLEILQATEILEEAIKKKSESVHYLKDWGSIENMLNQALIYDWRQDLGGNDAPAPAS